jgi:serine protease inhibitor ecotin
MSSDWVITGFGNICLHCKASARAIEVAARLKNTAPNITADETRDLIILKVQQGLDHLSYELIASIGQFLFTEHQIVSFRSIVRQCRISGSV